MDVAIVKYNAGNIYSVVNAMKRLGIEPVLTDDAEMLQKADRVLFPGQGQAREAMEYLKAHQLDQVIKNLKQPVLGICDSSGRKLRSYPECSSIYGEQNSR